MVHSLIRFLVAVQRPFVEPMPVPVGTKHRHKKKHVKPDDENMTMKDLIRFNPTSNPMPFVLTLHVRYLNIDHLGHIDCCRRDAVANSYEPHRAQPAAASLPASQASQQTQASREPASQQSESEEEDEDTGVIAPQVKIGPNGEIVIDQDSLVQRSVDLTPTIEYEIYLAVVLATFISTLSIIPFHAVEPVRL